MGAGPADAGAATPPPDPVDVGVLGSVNLDVIRHADGRVDEGLGGVLYTACALAHLGAGRVCTWLFARVAQALALDLRRRLSGLPCLRLDGLEAVPGDGYCCHIRYDDAGAKVEVLTGDIAPLTVQDLAAHLPKLRALLINFITGNELTLETLRVLRRDLRGLLLMDVHSLVLGRRADGTRYPRPPADWTSWIAQADVVQMNADEASVLGAASQEAEVLIDWCESLLCLGPSVAIVTRGAHGALAAYRADGAVGRVVRPAVAIAKNAPRFDPTGCGDVFLAGTAAGLITGMSVVDALDLASRAAAAKCSVVGIDGLYRLADA